jgi:hypothetical protein
MSVILRNYLKRVQFNLSGFSTWVSFLEGISFFNHPGNKKHWSGSFDGILFGIISIVFPLFWQFYWSTMTSYWKDQFKTKWEISTRSDAQQETRVFWDNFRKSLVSKVNLLQDDAHRFWWIFWIQFKFLWKVWVRFVD